MRFYWLVLRMRLSNAKTGVVRRRRALVLLAVSGALLLQAPAIAHTFDRGFERHVAAEGRGDTAQGIGITVGWAIRRDPQWGDASPPEALQVARWQQEPGCYVVETGTPVSCHARLAIEPIPGGFVVTANRRGETFSWDSTTVAEEITVEEPALGRWVDEAYRFIS